MALNFDAQVRLTEALLPLLRALGAERDRQRRQHRRPDRPPRRRRLLGVQGRARGLERLACAPRSTRHGVHVGIVMPGFIPTEGFPQRELAEKRTTRWMLGTPEQAAEAIVDAGLGRRAERYVPRFYGALAALRTVAPGPAAAGAGEQAAPTSSRRRRAQ